MTKELNDETPSEMLTRMPWTATEHMISPWLAGAIFASVVAVFSISALINTARKK